MTDAPPTATAARGPGPWQTATVTQIRSETATANTYRLQLPAPSAHLAGQHYILRLTAPDGYQASRSYSVASAPDGSALIELTIERLEGGEVSSFLHDDVMVGDQVEVRGPIGRWFTWNADAPALLVGGGSGIVPLMAMLRLARRTGRTDLVHVLISARSAADLYYRDELPGPEVTVAYTRASPPGTARPVGRLKPSDLPQLPPAGTAYVCGTPSFADAATDVLITGGIDAARIRVERFGPTS